MKTVQGLIILIISSTLLLSCDKDSNETKEELSVTDIRDGQNYKVVKIGSQTWMAENLKFKTDSGSWDYSNNDNIVTDFGLLYNWEIACDVCPNEWHLPTDEEWKELEKIIGMTQDEINRAGRRGTDEGMKLKSENHWFRDRNGTNEYSFNALPAGYKRENITYVDNIGDRAIFWTSTKTDSSKARVRELADYTNEITSTSENIKFGLSVRCIKDK